jgi:hypothetical protein
VTLRDTDKQQHKTTRTLLEQQENIAPYAFNILASNK